MLKLIGVDMVILCS